MPVTVQYFCDNCYEFKYLKYKNNEVAPDQVECPDCGEIIGKGPSRAWPPKPGTFVINEPIRVKE